MYGPPTPIGNKATARNSDAGDPVVPGTDGTSHGLPDIPTVMRSALGGYDTNCPRVSRLAAAGVVVAAGIASLVLPPYVSLALLAVVRLSLTTVRRSQHAVTSP